ncbi:hypothetical protein EIL82_03730 [Pandoraea apista]|nr:hypothetical protein EIB05_03795 [Pandoraea apista]RRJ81534.1 hypothetical protein EIL82_03730 [Pandoraea apista]RSD16725.1 hypothetical protein EJB12_05275 [Pandoraea apista]RSD19143.1 hypothetical protein EIZ52_10605 [Pandoraea apista]RSK87613.1 hypothetical protein EJE96_02085 [Pandoraea apista]
MQFIKNGPDIPERLLQAHEEGRVVFFCGAGISYPARLPGFSGLVRRLFDALGETPNAVQQAAIKAGQFDTAIGLLEAEIVGGRETVRRAIADILTPDLSEQNATTTHEALLTLGKSRDGRIRLITTNFDRLFEEVIANKRLAIELFQAPLLPVPKNRWNGLVYLHGLLSSAPTGSELDRLVVSSGDFGLAYLTERWAARFVSELFRNYTVCFVGYSINDPVLRYMMDALAADRLLGESPPEMFAFGSHSAGKAGERANEWRAKNVTPILYREHNHHSYLHKTLRAWANTYRDGVRGKERIVVECAMARPLASTKQDDFVGRLLWALGDPMGLAAKRFADFDPAPSLDWLEPLCEDRYDHADLARFGVPPRREYDDKLRFSLTRRPSPYTHAPWMMLAYAGEVGSQWDNVMFHLARWLTRHLDDPALVWWLIKRGAQLYDRFVLLVEHRLDELAKLEREGNVEELNRIRASAPNGIPRPMMRTLWRQILTGRVKSSRQDANLFRWRDRFTRDGLTSSLRLELREMLAPRVSLRQPFRWGEEREDAGEPQGLKDLIDWEIVLSADHVHSTLNDLAQSPGWRAALPDLLDDMQSLLRDALDLMCELGGADDRSDLAHWHLPSISPHWQNRGFRDWVSLIEILRDAWLATLESEPTRARRMVEGWVVQRYPTFKRLALFAATHDGVVADDLWVDWLLADDGWWLWSVETQRETMRLLVLRGASLPSNTRVRLEAAILTGPPRRMFRDDIEPDRWEYLVDHTVWLRLAKLAFGNTSLGMEARARLEVLSIAHPEWQVTNNQRDEFSHWMSGTGDPDYQKQRQFDRAPRRRRELMNWLQRSPSTHPLHEDDWREMCLERFPTAACALYALASDGIWPAERWREALQAWSGERLLRRSWHYLAPTLQRMPDDTLHAIAHSATWWLQTSSKVYEEHEAAFLDLCRRFLAMDYQDGPLGDQPVTTAINHPVGQVAQALLSWWFRRSPEDNQGLPDNLKPILTALCDPGVAHYRHARVLLAANVIALFRVDRGWATKYLLPLFDWHRSLNEARGAWEGFLWSPRLYLPLFAAFKAEFLETARHYAELGEHRSQYAAVLTYAALDPADTFTVIELRAATHALPQEGLQETAQALAQALEGAGEKREVYWSNRVRPYWQKIWPKSLAFASKAVAEHFARLTIAAGDAFPQALTTVGDWLQPLEHPYYVIQLLRESRLCVLYPQDALAFLDSIIESQPWPPPELQACLDAISQTVPNAVDDARYRRLMEYARRHG